MKTIKQVAEGFNLYQLQDIPQAWKDYSNFAWRVELGQRDNVIPEFLLTLKGYEVGLFFECETQDKGTEKELKFIEHARILLKKNDSDLLLMVSQQWRDKKYYLHPLYNYERKFHSVSHYLKKDALKGLVEPNYIGVFTVNKVENWVKYCNEYLQRLETLSVDVNAKNVEIEQKIKSFIDSVEGCEVSKYNNVTDITTSNFRVRFEHFKDQNYLNTKIDFRGSLADVTAIESAMIAQ